MKTAHRDIGLGLRMSQVRKACGMSQEEFSAKLAISRSAYQNYERAEREVPSSVVAKLVDQFDLDPLWLMFDDGDRRVIERNSEIGTRYDFLFAFIDERVVSLGRSISRKNKLALAHQLDAEYASALTNVANVSPRQQVIIDNWIVNMSEAA